VRHNTFCFVVILIYSHDLSNIHRAGKTVVGEMALRIALERNKKAIYTTPLKALSNQKFGEMRKVFGVENVGLATGDISIRRGADVTIMTTEVYRNMAWRSKSGISSLLDNADKDDDSIQVDVNKLESAARSERNDGVYSELSDNNVVVLDEFHYMGQKGRGSTWEEGEGELEYMGHDITNDFFFAGPIVEKKQPGHAYADIPLLLDSNPFAISLWINLSPLSDAKQNNDGRQPRVILSTNSKGYVGCSSDKFGNRSGIGIVLYAQPEYHHSYRIILEYADMTKKSCQTIGGSKQHDESLVREGEWNHISIFATRTSKPKEVKTAERISMYVNGELSSRNDNVSRDLAHVNSENGETIVGRYATPDEPHHSSSNDQHFGLGGRVGMLSFWETGGHARLSKLPTRMSVKTTDDEDHVVKMIQRAAFDIGAIKELSLRGLFVKKPTLLYPFQRREKQKEIKLGDGEVKLPDLSLELPPVANCNDLMSGKNGEIIVDVAGGDSHITTRRLHAKQPVKKLLVKQQPHDNADEQELDMYRGH